MANQIAPAKVVRAVLDRFDELDTDKDGCLTAGDILAALSPDVNLPKRALETIVSRTNSAKSQIEVHTPPDSRSASRVVVQDGGDAEQLMGFDASSNSAGSPNASFGTTASSLTQVRVSAPL